MSKNNPSKVVTDTTSDLKSPLPTGVKTPVLTKTKPRKVVSLAWSATKYLIVFLIIYTMINWWRQPVMPANPNLQLTDYQGQHIDIDALSHQSPVLVYFWGTWCGVCQLTSPTVDSLAKTSPYPVITIATQSGSQQELSQYMNGKGFNFTTINDESGEIFSAWEGQVTPSYVILKDGEMTQGLTGIQPKWSLRLRLWLSSLLH